MEHIDITWPKQDFKIAEAYKTLRTNIQFCGEQIKTIALTSSQPNEGKSTTALGLARALAEAGNKVLLIDADLRGSVFIHTLHINKSLKGLSHYLSGQCDMEEMVATTGVTGLHAVFSGPTPPNPAELLDGEKFEDMLSQARANYDYTIIDTPPLGYVIDCAVISKYCDGIVMVVASGETQEKLAQQVKRQIDKTDCPLLGVVLNKIDMGARSYYGGRYYGGKYGQYGDYYGHQPEALGADEL